MLYGIDISNHQKGLQLSTSAADMYIMKATEGTSYVDRTCDPWVHRQQLDTSGSTSQ